MRFNEQVHFYGENNVRHFSVDQCEPASVCPARRDFLCTEQGSHDLHIAQAAWVVDAWTDEGVDYVGGPDYVVYIDPANQPDQVILGPDGDQPHYRLSPDDARRLALALLVMADKFNEPA